MRGRKEDRRGRSARANAPEPLVKVNGVVDLFSGAGGLSEGFRQAGFEILGATDNDPDAAATYSLNFPAAKMVTGDIRDPKIKEQVLEVARAASVVVGGPPCQAFSQVRNHSRVIDDPRNSLYREFIEVLRATLPRAFLMENVTGMDQMGVRQQIADDLALEGEYSVLPQVVDSADFGVPQTRRRLLFLGVRAGNGMAPPVLKGTGVTEAVELVRRVREDRTRYAISIHENLFTTGVADMLADPEDDRAVTAADAISDLCELDVGRRNDQISYSEIGAARSRYQRNMRSGTGPTLENVQVPRINEDTKLRLRGVPRGGNHRDLPESLLDRYITGQKWGQDNGTGRLSRRHFYAYRRLHPDIWAWTLNTKADSVYHYDAPRALSVREFARLQSFPDRFVFTTDPRAGLVEGRHEGGPGHSRYRQVGNAVPPLLARAAASALLEQLRTSKDEELRALSA